MARASHLAFAIQEPRALNSKSFFIYDLESFLFHYEPGALDLETILFYDPESFLFHLEPGDLDPD
uniref:Uncharacterized protein n=1 Tax=Vitis vinifera TaxID=29760 RepID=F6HIU4_VITVI